MLPTIRDLLSHAIDTVTVYIQDVAVTPGAFSRTRKITAAMLLEFMIQMGASTLSYYIDEYFEAVVSKLTLCRQREKLAPKGLKTIYIADRGYCSLNNMATVIENSKYFLFRCKDVDSKGLLSRLELPNDLPLDTWITFSAARTQAKKIIDDLPGEFRYVNANTAFDYIPAGSTDTYQLRVRVTRFRLENGSWECVITNLPDDEFSPEQLKELYNKRWGIETSFRALKYALGTLSFHTYKPILIIQEIWAGLIACNLTVIAAEKAPVEQSEGNKYEYTVSFSDAARIVLSHLRRKDAQSEEELLDRVKKHLTPIRPGRTAPRDKKGVGRLSKWMQYRPA